MRDRTHAGSSLTEATHLDPRGPGALGTSLEPLRIAALDDDPGDLELLRRSIDEMSLHRVIFEGHQVLETLLDSLRGAPPHVLFLDHHLGERTGLEVVARLREIGCDVPVVLLTGQGSEEIAAAAVRAGVADYLPKRSLSAPLVEKTILDSVEKYRLRRALKTHAAMLEETNAELHRRNQEIQRFYHTLSHQLKTPLTVASEFIALLLDGQGGSLSDEQHEYLEIARDSCGQLAVSVNDLLDVSLLESGHLQIRPESCVLIEVVDRVLAPLARRAVEAGITVAWQAPATLPEVAVDPMRLAQVLRNLLDNALKYTPPGGRVRIEACRQGGPQGPIRVSVHDTGRGIAAEHLAGIFDRLGHATEDDSVTERGLGLGLTLCRELVRLWGGCLTVESETGAGSTFSFTVPVARG